MRPGWWMGVALLVVVLGGRAAAVVTCGAGGAEALPAGAGDDLEVTGPCTVAAGTYHYGNVNVYDGGVLTFDDAVIDFWTSGILVENDGTLQAGTTASPIGTAGGRLTIHLYGADQGAHPFGSGTPGGVGMPCRSAGGTCGVPPDVWNSDGASPVTLPGGVTDRFYAYEPLPYDDGAPMGFFGYKVLGVGYGGTLQLFGRQGATYTALAPTDPGTSWVRLGATAAAGATTITLATAVDWTAGSEIVVTTTDYLPGHSEQRTVTAVSADGKTLTLSAPLAWIHNGETFPLSTVPARVGLDLTEAETRAAVGLLTRSIRIVSAGDTDGSAFTETPGNFLGGHTVVRQGAKQVQVQGVEFFQLGQGGRMAHYPVHFHMARRVPTDTFVRDCSVHDSMTRWYVLHATQGVTLERNVGFKSIGHGYYIEEGSETDNVFHANLGVFARAAIDNVQNPRKVPGILASPDGAGEFVPFHSDWDHPTVFWIMNGWNDFIGNMAAGAGTCGTCYWLVPGANGGMSQHMAWDGYAGMQAGFARAATTPLRRFSHNACSTAMNAFNVVGNTSVCHGVNEDPATSVMAVPNPLAPVSGSTAGQHYYPVVSQGGGRFPTLCDESTEDCATVPICANGEQDRCAVTVLDHFTTAFNWTETNFAAIWLRPQWYLFVNGVVSDVQNGGLTFITGGDYTQSSTIAGHWALARKSAFIGQTQTGNPWADAGGPFNAQTGLHCDTTRGDNCLSRDEGVAVPISNFGVNQRLFNIYDGPAYQDSNAYLHVKETPVTGCDLVNGVCQNGDYFLYGRTLGIPRRGDACYLPNAAIGWKQPNGFYYPPAFRSRNLFFDDVDIRHFVIEPSFLPGTFTTDPNAVTDRYCTRSPGMFTGFTDVDRQTVLNDDDGSLTGLVGTISVNEDTFFSAPVETIQCASDLTSRTSPYEYVSTVVYPRCAVDGTCTANWSAECSTPACYGVPLYRQYLTKAEQQATNLDPRSRSIHLMGEGISQRSSLTVNHGRYYVDTTVSADRQRDGGSGGNLTVFEPGQTYYVFLLYGQPTTRQTYRLFVGKDAGFDVESQVGAVAVEVPTSPLTVTPKGPSAGAPWPAGWTRTYDADTGLLTVTMDLAAWAPAFAAAKQDKCQPSSFCAWTGDRCGCNLPPSDPLYAECMADDQAVCGWAGRDVDCPAGGCPGFAVTLASTFQTDPANDPRPKGIPFPDGKDPDAAYWNVAWTLAGDIAGSCQNPLLDVKIGTAGDDVLLGTKRDDLLLGKGGKDRIAGRAGNDTILGGTGADVLVGGAGNDAIVGGTGRDRLKGGSGDDGLVGEPGKDTLLGQEGTDVCTSGGSTRGCE